jgi:3',5'-cyclic AMP phosphodiesterase CpdA
MRIAHLSDPHLVNGPLGVQRAANLAEAISRLLWIEPRPDCVVITGDLADTGHPEEYATLRAILERCPVPVHLVTGNHDDPASLVAKFGDTRYLADGTSVSYAVEYPDATIVIADSWLEGSPAGYLGPEQLSWIDETLAARAGIPAFVCLHHPPLPVGMPYLDGMRLNDGLELGEVIARHSHVARVLAGHAHRVIMAPFAGTMMTVAPSTYRQSALRMHDDQPPGYLSEPTGFLLHVLDGDVCVTHSVSASHASAVFAFLSGLGWTRTTARSGSFLVVLLATAAGGRGPVEGLAAPGADAVDG